MQAKIVENETFAIREGEQTRIQEERPTSGRWIALMARSCWMPDGEKEPVRQSDSAPVEQAAILACQVNTAGKWQWMQLSPPTKETLGDLLFDSNVEKDKWYYATFSEVLPDVIA